MSEQRPTLDPAVVEAFRQVAQDRAQHRKTHAAQARRQVRAASKSQEQRQ